MKKAEYLTKIWHDKIGEHTQKVNGFISQYFGYTKETEKVKSAQYGKTREIIFYSITHLRTGLKLVDFDTVKQARNFILRMEQAAFPVSWDKGNIEEKQSKTVNMFSPNKEKMQAIYNLVRTEES